MRRRRRIVRVRGGHRGARAGVAVHQGGRQPRRPAPFVATRRTARAGVVSARGSESREREPDSTNLGSGSAPRKNASVGVSPSQSGEHSIAFAGGAAPPTTFGRGDGTEILSLSYAPFAKAAGGAAVFATFRCGAVRAYKTTFEAFSTSAATKKNGTSRTVPFPRRRRGALTPTLTAFLPSWPGVSRTLSRFVAIAPAMDPASPVVCAAAVAGGGAATYALPSVDGAPVNRSGALAATARDEREKKTRRRLRGVRRRGRVSRRRVRRRRRVAVETSRESVARSSFRWSSVVF